MHHLWRQGASSNETPLLGIWTTTVDYNRINGRPGEATMGGDALYIFSLLRLTKQYRADGG